jgi:hypothetical protein
LGPRLVPRVGVGVRAIITCRISCTLGSSMRPRGLARYFICIHTTTHKTLAELSVDA